MKHIYKNLMIWVVSLFGMSLTAQTVADKHKAMLPQSGKLQWEKPVKAMIKPQMPVIRTPHDRMHFPITSHSASLRAATVQAMQLDSIISCDAEGNKLTKTIYLYDAQGKEIESTSYSWNGLEWDLGGRYLYEYDERGNKITASRFYMNESEWILAWKDNYTYNDDNQLFNLLTNYYNGEKIDRQFYYEYNIKGQQTKYESRELREGMLTPIERSQYAYDSEGRQTHSDRQLLDENGEWYYTSYYNYGYNLQGWQTLYETYNWDVDKKELYLFDGNYQEFDDRGFQTYYESIRWTSSGYEKNINKFAYNADGKRIYYEFMDDQSSYYRHYIEELSYADDKLSGICSSVDTTILKDDSSQSIEMYSIDYTYNDKGYELSSTKYAVDPNTGKRITKIYADESIYDSLNRLLTLVSVNYENELKTSSYKYEYERPEKGESYIQYNYEQDLKTEAWILKSKSRHEYEEIGTDSYYYLDSYWDESIEDWIVMYGYKYESEEDGSNYTQIVYNWNIDSNDWDIIYGYKYVDETSGENYCNVNASYDIDNKCWTVYSSLKREAIEGNPKVYKSYSLPKNDLENWQLDGISYYYYSESSVANETIDAVDARIYTRPGTIHVDMEGKAALSVYAANGACCYQSSISGSTDVSSLQRGIYFVVLQSDSGTKKVKVLVK